MATYALKKTQINTLKCIILAATMKQKRLVKTNPRAFISPLVCLVVSVQPWTARRIGAAPFHSEPLGFRHQDFSQAERGEVRLVVHSALSFSCFNNPESCRVPHVYQWVTSFSDANCSIYPWFLYLTVTHLSALDFWAVALCLSFPLSSSDSCSRSTKSGRLRDSWTWERETEASQRLWEAISERSMQRKYQHPWNGIYREEITSE